MADTTTLSQFWESRPDLKQIWGKVAGVIPYSPSDEGFIQGIREAYGNNLTAFVETIYNSNPEEANAQIAAAGFGTPQPPATTPPATTPPVTTPPVTTPPVTTPPVTTPPVTTPPVTTPPVTTPPVTTPPVTTPPVTTPPVTTPPVTTGGQMNWWGSSAQPTTAQLLARWQAEGRPYPTSEQEQQSFNAWAGTVSPNGQWNSSDTLPVNPNATNGTGADATRNILGEGAQTLEAQLRLAPQMVAAYQAYAPRYAQTDLQTLGTTLFGPNWSGNLSDINQSLTQQAIAQTNTGNRAAREAGVADINEFGGQLAAARQNLNPSLFGNLDALDAQARSGVVQTSPYTTQMGNIFNAGINTPGVSAQQLTPYQISANQIGVNNISAPSNISPMANPWLTNAANAQRGQSGLGMDLTAMARQQLALGSGLSEEQKRNATQAAREGWSARGLINSTGAVAGEVLNRDAYGQQLLNQRQGFASGVEQLGQSQQGINDAYIQNILSQLGTRTGQDLSAQQTNAANQLEAGRLNQATDLARQSANQGANLQASQLNQANIFNTGQANQAANLNAGQFNAGLIQSDRQQQLGLGQYLGGLESTQQQQNFNNLLSQTQLRAQNQNDPFAILGIGTANQGTNAAIGGMGGTAASGGYGNQQVYQQFNPFSAYGSDVFNTNYNAQQSQILNAQNNAANLAAAGKAAGAVSNAGLYSAIGGIAGSFFGPIGTMAGSALGNYLGGGTAKKPGT